MQLHPYQKDALLELERTFRSQRRTLLSLPTGTGKTLVAATFAKAQFVDRGKMVIWIAHSRELLDQAFKAFTEQQGLDPAQVGRRYHKYNEFGEKEKTARVWLMNNLVIEGPGDDPDLIVIDEAHHAASESYTGWLSFYKAYRDDGPLVLGLTATPYRLESGETCSLLDFTFSKPAKPIFQSIAFRKSFCELAAIGRVAPFHRMRFDTNMDFQMKKSAGDFSGDSLGQLNTTPRNKFIHGVWQRNREKFGKTLIFVGTQDHAKKLAKMFGEHADYVVSDDDGETRDDIVARFRKTNGPDVLDVLVNVGIFKEGVDVPAIRTVILARPTMSASLFTQMVGRGSRVLPDKRFFYLVDIHDQLGKYESYLAGVDDLADRRPDIVETVARRGAAAEVISGLRIASIARDPAALIDLIGMPTSEILIQYAGWAAFETEQGESRPIAVFLDGKDFAWLSSHATADGRVPPTARAVSSSNTSESLGRCARALSEGLWGRCFPILKTDGPEIDQLKRQAEVALDMPRERQAGIRTFVDWVRVRAAQWGVPESDIGRTLEQFVGNPDAYGAVVTLRAPTGNYLLLGRRETIRVLRDAMERKARGQLGFGDGPQILAKIQEVEPDLGGHGGAILDGIHRAAAIGDFCMLCPGVDPRTS
ncbi:MAG: DEAD/DEAH box helicase [Proteobacteria bacterium]|nr:DEAD/DEAH box helicase [Pseudomonadota bacterium]